VTVLEKSTGGTERFTIVAAVYNVARYLPDFIASIEAQSFPSERLQVVAVDDGSTDESFVVLKEWEARRPELVTVLTKENGGQGSARNLGLEHATGEWVTFTDPDDMLAEDYLATVDEFISDNPSVAMIATNRILFEEAQNRMRDGHPLRRMFYGGDQLVDLGRFPQYFHGSAPASFLRADRLRSSELLFDDRVQPNFEDGHLCARYLLECDQPHVGFLKSAKYIYRKRADQSSTLQGSLFNAMRYNSVPRFGYLDALEKGSERFGRAPEWLQNFVLYELSYYFSADQGMSNAQTAAVGETAAEFIAILRILAPLFDEEVVESFSIRRFDRAWRDIMIHGLREKPWHTPYVVLQSYDSSKDLVKVAYRFSGELPVERILVRGKPFKVEHSKIRGLHFFEHVLLRERIVWVPLSGSLRVTLDGRPVQLRTTWPVPMVMTLRPSQMRQKFKKRVPNKPVRAPKNRPGMRHRLTARASLLCQRLGDHGPDP
jgi:glycosyltransferase involved in cell wall biosynthesis